MSETALNIIRKHIVDYQVQMEDLKIKIADVMVDVHNANPNDARFIHDCMKEIAALISELKVKDQIFDELFKTQLEVEDELERIAKMQADVQSDDEEESEDEQTEELEEPAA